MKDKGTLVVISGFSGAGKEQYPKLSLKSLDTVFRFRQQPVSREKENRTEENTTLNQKMISYV